MADKSSLQNTLTKRLSRARESFLQTFGKSEKTKDQQFDEAFKAFSALQNSVMKYQKEIKQYYDTVKRMKTYCRLLMNSVWDLYDPSWIEYEQIREKADAMENCFSTYIESLKALVLDPMKEYVLKIDQMNARVAKRDKKRLDFDAGKHNLGRRESAKNRDTEKIEKASKKVELYREVFEKINADVIQELKQFCETRINFIAPNLKNFFNTEMGFHAEFSKLHAELREGMVRLDQTRKVDTEEPSTSLAERSSEGESLEISSDDDLEDEELDALANGNNQKVVAADTEALAQQQAKEISGMDSDLPDDPGEMKNTSEVEAGQSESGKPLEADRSESDKSSN